MLYAVEHNDADWKVFDSGNASNKYSSYSINYLLRQTGVWGVSRGYYIESDFLLDNAGLQYYKEYTQYQFSKYIRMTGMIYNEEFMKDLCDACAVHDKSPRHYHARILVQLLQFSRRSKGDAKYLHYCVNYLRELYYRKKNKVIPKEINNEYNGFPTSFGNFINSIPMFEYRDRVYFGLAFCVISVERSRLDLDAVCREQLKQRMIGTDCTVSDFGELILESGTNVLLKNRSVRYVLDKGFSCQSLEISRSVNVKFVVKRSKRGSYSVGSFKNYNSGYNNIVSRIKRPDHFKGSGKPRINLAYDYGSANSDKIQPAWFSSDSFTYFIITDIPAHMTDIYKRDLEGRSSADCSNRFAVCKQEFFKNEEDYDFCNFLVRV